MSVSLDLTGTATRIRAPESVAIIAEASLAAAIDQVRGAAADASSRPVRALAGDTGASDDREPVVSPLLIGNGVRPRSLQRALVLATNGDRARHFVTRARRLGVAPAAIDVAIVAPDNRHAESGDRPPRVAGPAPGDRAWPLRVVRRAPGDPARLRGEDAAWLGRHLARAKLGVALGAGGAWGFAHIGALGVLEEAGYVVDAVAGASVGAVVGALLALGRSVQELTSDMRRVFNPSTARELFAVSLAGVSPGRERMVAMLRDFCGERCLESLPIALSVAVIDLEARAPRALTRGSMWQALAAATALPGLYPPWECDGVRLADALVVDPVPTRYLDDADVTIAIDLLGGAAAPPRRRRGGHGAAAQLLGALTEVLDVAALDASSRHAARADVIVRPAFAPSRWRDVELADHFIEAGRDAARQQLPALASVISPHKPQTGGIHG